MTKATTAHGRVEPEPQPKAKSVFGKVRLSAAGAFGALAHTLGVMLYRRVLYPNRTPNQETIDALREADAGTGVTEYDSLEDFRKDMDSA